MRYFVYKDSQIRGPFAPDELGSGGLTPEALVCAETATGRHGGDWITAAEVAELSSFRSSLGAATAVLDEPVFDVEAAGLERLELDSLGVPSDSEDGEGWLLDIFEDAEFRQRWGDLVPKPSKDPGDLFGSKSKISELTSQIEALQSRIKELEKGGFAKPAGSSTDFRTAIPKTMTPAGPPGPQSEFQKQGAKFTFTGKPKAAPQGGAKPIRFVPSQSFRVVEKEPHPAQAPQPEPSGMSGFPQAGSAPPLAGPPLDFSPPPLPAAPEPAPFSAPQFNAPPTQSPAPTLQAPVSPPQLTPAPSAAPPMTMMFGVQGQTPAPSAPAFPAFEAPKLEAPPIPQMPTQGGPGLATGIFSGSAMAAPAALTPSRANLGAMTPAGADAGTEDVIARLAKPAATPATGARAQPRRFPTMAVVGVVGVLALVGLVFVFLHNSRGLKSMVAMGGDQKPIGAVPEDEAKAPPFLPKAAPQPVPAPPPAVPVAPAPAPAPAPVAGKDMIPDAGDAAIALVKNYPLSGDRNSVGQWIAFKFTANPAEGNKDVWNAGAVDATTFAVECHVQPGPHSALQAEVAYIFEADVSRKTVKGTNQAARELFLGGALPQSKKAKKPAVRRRVRAVGPPPEPRTVPLLPLPSDSDLLPPAADDSGFKTDTVQPGL
jgi:hypothetical protein